MEFEKLTDNKIKIFLNASELRKQNIDAETFLSNAAEAQAIYLAMLNKAEEELNFTTQHYRIAIEALCLSGETFIFTITRFLSEVERPKVIPKKKKNKIVKKTSCILKFENFHDFYTVCSSLPENLAASFKEHAKSSSLYLFNNTYYLVITCLSQNLNNVISYFAEFGEVLEKNSLFEERLKEYGKIIFDKKALLHCIEAG